MISVKQHILTHHKRKVKTELPAAFRPKKSYKITDNNKKEVLAHECAILSKFKLPMDFFQRYKLSFFFNFDRF